MMNVPSNQRLGVSFILLMTILACSPPQKIFMKEKLTERNAPPRSGIMTNRFIVGQAAGPVDILFIVDNTETIEQAVTAFRQSYTHFVSLLKSPRARLLDYRVQWVTTPSNQVTKNTLTPSQSEKLHLSELFEGIDHSSPVFSGEEVGFLRPFLSTLEGLNSHVFQERPPGTLFLVYLLGADGDDAAANSEGATPGVIGSLNSILSQRGLFQTQVLTLTKTTELFGRAAFPNCHTFQSAEQTQSMLQQIQWKNRTEINLCDPQWPAFSDSLFESILASKQEFVLSQAPYQPETMTLRGSSRLFRYGDDYVFDPLLNRISFLKEGLVQEGDLLEVAYYLTPGDGMLPGNPVPQSPFRINGVPRP